MRFILLLLPAALLLPGCIGDSGGSAKLSYEGDEVGMHSASSDCDKDGHLLGSGSIDRGSVRVTVTTDDGEHYTGSFTGDFTLASQELTGQSGDWTLTVSRIGGTTLGLTGFAGSYSFTMTC
jgi:hypothetical protein